MVHVSAINSGLWRAWRVQKEDLYYEIFYFIKLDLACLQFSLLRFSQVSAYASLGNMTGMGPTVEKQRRRMDPTTSEPQFTNCTRDFLGTLDYIFYTGKTALPSSNRSGANT